MIDEMLARLWEHLGGRVGGPLTLRLILQPLVAGALAIRAGIGDARAGRPAYFWTILTTTPANRRKRIFDGWRSVARVFVLAAVMDIAYQIMVFRWVYPGEVLIVSFLLACLPYLLLRGPANRIARVGRTSKDGVVHLP